MLSVVFGLSLVRPASAECIIVPLKTLMKTEEIVLLGHVDAIRSHMVSATSTDYSIVTISVKTLWKGTTRSVIELQQTLGEEAKNFWTGVGKDYVLFIRTITPERPLTTKPPITLGYIASGQCSSGLAAEFDLKALGPGRAPLP